MMGYLDKLPYLPIDFWPGCFNLTIILVVAMTNHHQHIGLAGNPSHFSQKRPGNFSVGGVWTPRSLDLKRSFARILYDGPEAAVYEAGKMSQRVGEGCESPRMDFLWMFLFLFVVAVFFCFGSDYRYICKFESIDDYKIWSRMNLESYVFGRIIQLLFISIDHIWEKR